MVENRYGSAARLQPSLLSFTAPSLEVTGTWDQYVFCTKGLKRKFIALCTGSCRRACKSIKVNACNDTLIQKDVRCLGSNPRLHAQVASAIHPGYLVSILGIVF